METNLKQYFPMIREREAVLADIRESTALTEVFYGWKEGQREEFLNSCTGVRGMKILYDVFFKEIFDPETAPERLNALLSTLLKQKVEIVGQLPNDSPRLADETSLLIMDIVVRLQDGSICNVEVQKIGYLFPGQRSACYSADLLLRQYRRMRGEKQKQFRYRDIKPVYTIVFFESSPKEFHEFPDIYYHYFYPKSDTGLKLELLQNYLFIPLDIFREIQHNNGIRNELEAWLTFLSADEPDAIVRLIEGWPEFKPMYVQLYVQDSLASLGAGFGSAFADIIHIRIPALYTSFRSAQSQRPPDVVRPRGAYIRWEIELPLIQTCCSPPVEVGVISHLIYV